MFKYFNCFFSSFFRTLGRIIVYILLGLVFSTILSKIDVHADTIKGVYSHGYINGTNSFLSGMDEGNFSKYKSLSSGVEPTINLAIEDFTLSSENYLVVMTYCTTTTNYINVITPNSSDIQNAKLTGNYGTNNNLGLCRVGEYNGALFQGVFGVSKLPNYESFQLRIWGGTSYTYNTFIQIVDVSLYYDTPETRNSFINNINSNKIINQNQEIINGQNKVIDNQNNNTDKVIDNQNNNTDKQIDSQKVCEYIDKSNIIVDGALEKGSGKVVNSDEKGVTDFIKINNSSKIKNVLSNVTSSLNNLCFYNVNKEFISCVSSPSYNNNDNITIPTTASYVRFTIIKSSNRPTFEICTNGNQAISGGLNDINGSLNNSDTSGATNDASNFFNDFTTDLHGLTGIITAPLNAINSLSNKTCSPLVLPLPFVDKDLTLPCMRSIYDDHFGAFMTLYDTITFGIVSYWVCVRIFSFVKDFKNPEHDEIEVVDL